MNRLENLFDFHYVYVRYSYRYIKISPETKNLLDNIALTKIHLSILKMEHSDVTRRFSTKIY